MNHGHIHRCELRECIEPIHELAYSQGKERGARMYLGQLDFILGGGDDKRRGDRATSTPRGWWGGSGSGR